VVYDRKFGKKEITRFRREEKELRLEIARIVGKMVENAWVSREELAEALGYHGTTQFSKWKSGKATIPPEKLALLARVLECSITQFFPANVHQQDWLDGLQSAVYKGQAKKAMEIVLKELTEENEGNDDSE
jgi:transcriptional regulator with XRE-family HTH domain